MLTLLRFTCEYALVSLFPMQRLYSMFPLGGPGVGLVSLRLAIALAFYIEREPLETTLPDMFAVPCLVVMALALLLGFLTPIFASLALFAGCLAAFQANGSQIWMAVVIVLIAISLLLLGPGAYSWDACIYGRRIVTPRPKKDR